MSWTCFRHDSKKILNLSYLKAFVLDEADEMLSKGFLEKIKETIAFISPETKVLLFSATMPKEIVTLTEQFMNTPVKIFVKNENLTLDGIKQYYVYLKKEDKIEILIDIYRNLEISQAVIFCNSKNTVEFVAAELAKKGHMVSAIHGDKLMTERDSIMKDFRSGATRVLVTTDLLARGIDVQQLSVVINYELPREKETYIHRIGRSGRHGKKGNAINFVTPSEKDDLEALEKYYSTCIEKLPTDLSMI